MKANAIYSSTWVQSSLHQCELLEEAKSVSIELGQMVKFAIRWAPFGGASAGDILVAFGVSPQRFMQMLEDGLGPRHGDSQHSQSLKGSLLQALTSAWQVSRDSMAGPARC
jgi:hypothetical protein